MQKIIKSLTIVLGCFCLSTLLVACGQQSSNPQVEQQNFTDFAGIEKEYLTSLEKLSWPENTVLPTKLENETAESFQIGYGDTKASLLWEYTWTKEWLNYYQSDSEKATRALSELDKALSMGYMSPQRTDDSTRNYFKDNLEKAKLGDPSGFEESLRANS